MPGNVSERMGAIQKLFLDVEKAVEKIDDLNAVIRLLDEELPEFRSVAYESASMAIGARDLFTKNMLGTWKEFRQLCSRQHSFHIDIGLGWAFAKIALQPEDFLKSFNPVVKWMVYDGIGYYNGLFRGRNTIKQKIIPEETKGESMNGFDQGLGRRLWYMAKGNVDDLIQLLQSFNEARHHDLWRGVGIACGYVGGSRVDALENLLNASAACNLQFRVGIMLAAISRIASNSVNEDINIACRVICKKTIEELSIDEAWMADNFFYLYNNNQDSDWLSQLESYLGEQSEQTSPLIS